MARTTRSQGMQDTYGPVPNPIRGTDIVNKQSIPGPGPTQGLHAVRWFCTSSGPDQQVNFDPLGRPFSGTADQFPGLDVSLKKIHFWNYKASRAGLYVELRKNNSTVSTWTIPKGTGAQVAINVTYVQHSGPPVTQDLGAWYINGTATGGNSYGMFTLEYDIINDI